MKVKKGEREGEGKQKGNHKKKRNKGKKKRREGEPVVFWFTNGTMT